MAEDLTKTVLASFIIISLIAVFMLIFITRGKEETWNFAEKEICKKSVDLQARQKQYLTVKGTHLTDVYGNQVELKCPTQYLTIKSKDEENVKRKIADSMYHCWDQFGKGEVEIFDTQDQNFCVVCSRLEFEKIKKVTSFTQFLIENNPPNSDESYFQLLNSVKAKDNEVLEEYENSYLKNKDSINLENPLAVVFVMGKNAFPDARLGAEHGKFDTIFLNTGIALAGGLVLGLGGPLTLVAGAAGAGIGYFAGSDTSAEWDAKILLWNYNDISKLDCTYLEGQASPLQPYEMNKYK